MNTFSLVNHTNGTLERMEATRNAAPARFSPARAIADAGDGLTRRGLAALAVEHLTQALLRLIELAYELDHDARLCNVDAVDGRLLIPAPWGSAGYRRYGLRRREADVLRLFLFDAMTRQSQIPLFQFDRRCWCINLVDYPTQADAAEYLAKHGLTIRAYKAYLRRVQQASRR